MDNGLSWSGIATDQGMDRFGRGSFLWTAGPETDPLVSEALIRVTADDGSQPSDESDAAFLIANAGERLLRQ